MNDDVTFVFRRAQRKRLWCPLVLAICGALSFVQVFGLFVDPPAGTELTGIDVAAFFGMFLVFVGLPAWLSWRALHMRVVITRSAVVVHNLLGSKTVPLQEIAGFEPDARSGLQLERTLLRLTAGPHGIPRSVGVPAMSPGVGSFTWLALRGGIFLASNGWHSAQLEAKNVAQLTAVIDEMNAALDRRWNTGGTAADRLKAAHPAFRAMPHDD